MHAKLNLDLDCLGPEIRPEHYGHFSEHLGRCVYDGLWVGQDSPIANLDGFREDVVSALKELKVPVLRWPGGCFADEYHWRDGIGPRAERPRRLNTHWGNVVENNEFGTHEFFDLCERIGAEPYVAGNLGSGAVREMAGWVEYITCGEPTTLAEERAKNGHRAPWSLKYFGVGNENWGCGGNFTAEAYADAYRRYASFLKSTGPRALYKIACGPNSDDFEWTRVMMRRAGTLMDGLSLHYYTLPTGQWLKKGAATDFDEQGWHETLHRTLRMESLVHQHAAIMDGYDPERKVGLVVDEWGTWCDAEPGTNPAFLYQQSSLRDALVTALNLHIFQRYAERVTMANLAQTVNVLQAVLLTQGPELVRTPTYYALKMMQGHQGARRVSASLSAPEYQLGEQSIPGVSAAATVDAQGTLLVSLANTHATKSVPLELRLIGSQGSNVRSATGWVLTGDSITAYNDFPSSPRGAAPEQVAPRDLGDVALADGRLSVTLAARSLTTYSMSLA